MDRYVASRQDPSPNDGSPHAFRPTKMRTRAGYCQLHRKSARLILIMGIRRFLPAVQTWLLVALAGAVPAFAQTNTNTTAGAAVDFITVAALREYVADAPGTPGASELPRNVNVGAFYRQVIRTMLERSPTFRRQCIRISNSSQVAITIERSEVGTPWTRARTRIERGRDGTLSAAIQLVGREDPVELIAHEFEHIIEQLDGIDLSSRVHLPSSGVSRGRGEADAFETTRAKRMGVTVAAEVRRSVD